MFAEFVDDYPVFHNKIKLGQEATFNKIKNYIDKFKKSAIIITVW